MSQTYNNVLIASLLALYDFDSTLTEDEKSKLNKIAQQLLIDPEQWDTAEETLLQLIDNNFHLKPLFQSYKSRLEQDQTEIPLSLIPQGSTLDPVAPKIPISDIQNKGAAPGNKFSEAKSTEIVNAFIRLASTSDPSASIKNVKDFEQVKQLIQ